jgi:hypothetical protein
MMKKLLAGSIFLCALVALAQSQGVGKVPRWNGNPPMATTTAAPTLPPQPEYGIPEKGCFAQSIDGQSPCHGNSKILGNLGALHLAGCSSYSIAICGDGGTLSGAGTVQIWSWPEFPSDAGGLNLWARNKGLDETITVAGTTQCQRFPGHVADGMGWIYPAPNSVTVSAGVVSVEVDAVCGD